MNDFIHCNKCFALPDSSGKKFLLTSCSHIFCYSCSASVANERTCLKCKKRCNLIQLDSGIKPDIKMYFEPLDKLIFKLTKIEKFQRTHREHLLKHLTSETSKGNQAQEKWERKMSDLKKEINHLRSKLNNRYDPIKTSSSSVGGYYSRQNNSVLGPSRQGTSSSRLQCNSTFGSLRGAPITPLIDHRITNLDQRSNASSKITLRSVSDLSSFQTR